jgi:hypothetical protein
MAFQDNQAVNITGGKIILSPGTTATPSFKLSTQASGLTTVEQGAMELIGNSLQFTNLAKRRSVVQAATVLSTGVSVTNTLTETTLISSQYGANYLEVGKCEEIVLRGIIGKNINDVLTLRLKYAGATVITLPIDGAAITAGTALGLQIIATCRSTGASGTMQINVISSIDGRTNPPDTRALVTINTTTAATLALTAQWGAAVAANTLTIDHGRVLCIDGAK